MKIINKRTKQKLLLVINMTLLLVLFSGDFLQADDQTAIIRMGKYWCGVVDDGGTATFSYGSLSWFPNDYNCQGPTVQDGTSQTGSGFLMAATNWQDPLGNVIPKAAVLWSPDTDYNWGQMVTVPMTDYVRWPMPLNYILQPADTEVENKQVEQWGVPDATKMIGTCDQVVEVTTQGPMGVEIHRKVFAWSQQYHDNYIVCDVTLTNKSGKTLTDFYLNLHQGNYYISKAAGSDPSVSDLYGGSAANPERYTWHHYDGAKPGDSLRIYYMYHADNPERTGDQMGLPIYNQDGRLFLPEMHFYTILHASEKPYINDGDDVDDFLQPKVTDVFSRPLVGLTEEYAKTNANRPKLYDYVAGYSATINPTEGAFAGTFHQKPNDEFGEANWSASLPGLGSASTFHSRYCSFGPYTEFKNGEKLHFIYASGYAGLSLEKAKEVGEKWQNGTLEDVPNPPDPRTGYFPGNFAFPTNDENDLRKNRWLSTGIDSVHKAASRAKWNYEHNWQVPMAPEPPHMWVQGTGEGTEIRWAAPDAESMDGFYGYRLLRRVGRSDTVFYQEVKHWTADELTAEPFEIGDTPFTGYKYIDENILWGASYYYYVQAGVRVAENDLNAYPTSRGKILWSGRVWSTSRLNVSPERAIGGKLTDIRIVPNPYNIADPVLLGYGLDADDPRMLLFFNLPARCTIKIFTESGDLIKTIEHAPLSKAGLYQWNMLTDNQQAISSGIYIAVFETPEGEVSYQKFIVVR